MFSIFCGTNFCGYAQNPRNLIPAKINSIKVIIMRYQPCMIINMTSASDLFHKTNL